MMTPELELLYATLSLREFAIQTLPPFLAGRVSTWSAFDDDFLMPFALRIQHLAGISTEEAEALEPLQMKRWNNTQDLYRAFEFALYSGTPHGYLRATRGDE